jgi:FAD/FMN-containing dehydrogenase/Fe-S oxidoreductase
MNLAAFEQELRRRISGEVRFDQISRALYSTDASVYQIEPAGVVIPRSREDVIAAFAVCREFGCPVTMRGGGTSQAGQAIGEGLQIDCSKYYSRLLEVNAAERWVRVEPGIVLDELNAQLAPLGMRFAPDISTASRATIGGMIANNSAGARSVLYGKTIDHVLETTVLLSDGSIAEFRDVPRSEVPVGQTLEARCYGAVIDLAARHAEEIERRFPKVMRRVGGFNLDEFTDAARPVNLAKMIVGSEGTLGIVLEAKLKLTPLPKAKSVMAVMFNDLLESLAATPVILRHGPSAVEVMDQAILDNTKQNANLNAIRSSFIKGEPASTLCVEFYADRAEDLPPRLAALEQDLRSQGYGYHYHSATNPAEQARIWSLREAALGLSMATKGDAKSVSFVEDTAVAPEKLSEFIGRFLRIVEDHGTTAGVYAHASVGCLHVRPVINLKTADGVAKFESVANAVADLVLEFGGALSGEHGDGYVRSPFMEKMFGPDLYDAFRQVKGTFDPAGLLNPGKIVDSPPLTKNLRYGTKYRTASPFTFFDYGEHGGIAGAVEMCSGVGACRKKLAGTMCPSYMATREEAASTRGRANVLRLALSGKIDEAGLGDDGVREALDLCLECRACKAECPVGVDVARFKSEFLSDYYSRHGVPAKAKAMGNIHKTSMLASRAPRLANRIALSAPVRWMNEVMLGIDSRRRLPQWADRTFAEWASARTAGAGTAVTLFNDTFTNHYDPEIGIVAVELLERAGCAVSVVRPGCCGRPLISQGLLREARQNAEALVEALHPIAARGEAILFCEPSCLSVLKEDAPDLVHAELRDKAREVAARCLLFDEFASKLPLKLRPVEGRILLHGHCHQKSMGMLGASLALLSKIPNAKIADLDAGCCGMAGSFGYAKNHYDVSRTIAERKLLPAVRAMNPGDVLVATGTSCRHQVADFGNTNAVHPAVLVRSLLE